MKKFAKCFTLILVFLCSSFIFVACRNNNSQEPEQIQLTNSEIIAQAKNKLTYKFSNTKIYTDISLPNHYEIESKYDVYITWDSSNYNIINPTSGQVNRTLQNQNCILIANILYKDSTDNINFYLTIPANIYSDTSNGFPQKDTVEIKVSYMELSNNLKLKIKIANNSKRSENIYGINSMTFSIYYQGYHYLVKDLQYTNQKTRQFVLEPGKCIEIDLPELSKNSLITKYLTDSTYYCKISSLSYYNSNGSITHVLY